MHNLKLKSLLTLFAVAVLGTAVSGCQKDPVLATGQDVFTKYCATCHQQDGQGIDGAFPSLHASEWVNGDTGRLIRLTLRGMQGAIVINGKTYNNAMTPHGFLTDDQIAGVLTFVRQEFSNSADPVTSEEVAAVRSSLVSDDMYIASELEHLTGIPEAPVAPGASDE